MFSLEIDEQKIIGVIQKLVFAEKAELQENSYKDQGKNKTEPFLKIYRQ